MQLQIRDAQPDDAGEIVGIINPIIEAGLYTVFDRPFTEDEERRYIAALPLRAVFHVAVSMQTEKIVGFQSLEPFATYTGAFDSTPTSENSGPVC